MRQRRAFTLVEMLVSMALIIFIMVILTQAFVAGLETFRQLKAIGDMEQRLRSVVAVLRDDLTADHFEGRRRLSDPDFWLLGPPREGFFRIWQGSTTLEGADPDGVLSVRATNHALHYTVRRRGNRRESFFAADIPPMNYWGAASLNGVAAQSVFFEQDNPATSRFQEPGMFTSQWAEIAVFLRPNGTTTLGVPAGTNLGTPQNPVYPIPLFGLYRRALLAVPNNRHANWDDQVAPNPVDSTPINVTSIRGNYSPPNSIPLVPYLTGNSAVFSQISCKKRYASYAVPFPMGDRLFFNNPTDLTIPERRFGMTQERLTLPSSNVVIPAGYPIRAAVTTNTTLGYAPDWSYPKFGDAEGDEANQNPSLPLLTQDATREGTDLLLNDVISFDVSVLVTMLPDDPTRPDLPRQPAFIDLFDARLYKPPIYPAGQTHPRNPSFYDSQVPVPANRTPPAVFDTWSSQRDDVYNYTQWATVGSTTSAPLVLNTDNRLVALKITLRVWDQKTQQARQVTLIQDM